MVAKTTRLVLSGILMLMMGALAPVMGAIEFKEGTLIRDAETEAFIKTLTDPIFKVAGKSSKNLKIVLIATPEINAAAALGPTLLLNTGLILKCDGVEELAGVLAHEIGHIAGGHVVRGLGMLDQAQVPMMASIILGLAGGIASGDPTVGISALMLGNHLTDRTLLHYSRGQEATADEAAMRYLRTLGWTNAGLIKFMKKLQGQDLQSPESQDPYVRTHPLEQDRIDAMERHSVVGDSLPNSYHLKFKRIRSKLEAFMTPPGIYLGKAKAQDLDDQYGRAIAFYRQGDHRQGTLLINELLTQFPKDPYYWELKGQMLFENGKVQEAQEAYKQAYAFAPQESLILMGYVQILLENEKGNPELALTLLQKCHEGEKQEALYWQLKAIAFGKTNKMGPMALALAEKAFIQQDYKMAKEQSKRALAYSNDKPSQTRAKDIIEQSNRIEIENPKLQENRFQILGTP